MPLITVFGSSEALPGSFEYETAERLGSNLAKEGFDIASGGYSGVMEAVLKGASDYNVKRIGVTNKLVPVEKINSFVDIEYRMETYLERMSKLIEIADEYIVLPGGSGTLLEFAAIWVLKERGLFKNKLIICIGEQWEEILRTMGFYSEKARNAGEFIKTAENAEEAVNFILHKNKSKE
ncbi:MAG: LOG family protein [FCB group bacterium]|jgi:uncharacterized protein (TIGR00730 family)